MTLTPLGPLAELTTRSILATKPTDPNAIILSAWAQGFMVGAIIIMFCVTVANMRRGVLLHKLILIELLFGFWHGTYIFTERPVYSWYLSVTALLLNISWSLHNVIAWMKNKPFLGKKASWFYIGTVILAQPYWVVEIYADFAYFAGTNTIFVYTRPWEALFRDPWWVFTTWSLFYNIRSRYEFGFLGLIRISPRFGILLGAMLLSLAFTLLDILSVTNVLKHDLPAGIDPFWELAFVFKLLTDTMILDDFKSALDRLHNFKLSVLNNEDLGTKVTTAYEGAPDPRRVPSLLNEENLAAVHSSSTGGWPASSKVENTHIEYLGEPNRDRETDPAIMDFADVENFVKKPVASSSK